MTSHVHALFVLSVLFRFTSLVSCAFHWWLILTVDWTRLLHGQNLVHFLLNPNFVKFPDLEDSQSRRLETGSMKWPRCQALALCGANWSPYLGCEQCDNSKLQCDMNCAQTYWQYRIGSDILFLAIGKIFLRSDAIFAGVGFHSNDPIKSSPAQYKPITWHVCTYNLYSSPVFWRRNRERHRHGFLLQVFSTCFVSLLRISLGQQVPSMEFLSKNFYVCTWFPRTTV